MFTWRGEVLPKYLPGAGRFCRSVYLVRGGFAEVLTWRGEVLPKCFLAREGFAEVFSSAGRFC